jgi:hypothetical protein
MGFDGMPFFASQKIFIHKAWVNTYIIHDKLIDVIA